MFDIAGQTKRVDHTSNCSVLPRSISRHTSADKRLRSNGLTHCPPFRQGEVQIATRDIRCRRRYSKMWVAWRLRISQMAPVHPVAHVQLSGANQIETGLLIMHVVPRTERITSAVSIVQTRVSTHSYRQISRMRGRWVASRRRPTLITNDPRIRRWAGTVRWGSLFQMHSYKIRPGKE